MATGPREAPQRTHTAADIADQLMSEVRDEGLQPGDRIGSERELSDRLEVSRWLIRKALGLLENQGQIIRITGRGGGIFIAHQRVVRDLRKAAGIPEYLREQGLEAGTTVLSTAMSPADEEVANALEVPEGSLVIHIERIRVVASVPLNIEQSWFPAAMFPGFLDHSLVGSLLDLLETEYKIKRGEAVETISAKAADQEESTYLQVEVGAPLLTVKRVARLVSGEPFEYSEEVFRADRLDVVVHTAASGFAKRVIQRNDN